MKNLSLILSLFAVALGLSSCSMTNRGQAYAGSYETTKRVQSGYTKVEEVTVLDAKSGLVETTTTKVPTYKDKTEKKRVPCPTCVRFYWLPDGCCGSDMDPAIKMATSQGSSGSPQRGGGE